MVAALQALGVTVVCRPTIAFLPPRDPAPMHRALADVREYAWIVFTSAQGVRALAEHLPAGVPGEVGLAAVGPATARAAAEHGWVARVVGSGGARVLAAALTAEARRGQGVLWARAEEADDALLADLQPAFARVDAVAFYRTVAATDAVDTAAAVARGEFDAALFTSPSSWRSLRDAGRGDPAFGEALERLTRLALGSTTEAALIQDRFPPAATAGEPNAAAVVEAVSRALGLVAL